MPYLIGVAVALLVLILIFLLVVATRPSDFRIQRTGEISAPPEVVFGFLNDFHQWALWSPWEKLDPTMKKTFEGPPAGPGSTYAWVGNKKVGEGRMTMLETRPGERLAIKLEFFKPFAATNTTLFTLTPSGGGGQKTQVHWAMDGKNNFMGKAFCMFMNMDKLVGTDFEKGLANLNVAAQAQSRNSA